MLPGCNRFLPFYLPAPAFLIKCRPVRGASVHLLEQQLQPPANLCNAPHLLLLPLQHPRLHLDKPISLGQIPLGRIRPQPLPLYARRHRPPSRRQHNHQQPSRGRELGRPFPVSKNDSSRHKKARGCGLVDGSMAAAGTTRA